MEKGITQIQVLGDSLLVIKWLKGEVVLRNFILQPFFCDIKNLQASFSHINFLMSTGKTTWKLIDYPKMASSCKKAPGKSMSPSRDKLLLTFMSHGFNILSVLSDDLEKYVTSKMVLELSFECFKVRFLSMIRKLLLNTRQVAFVKNYFKGDLISPSSHIVL
jgi:hypothetical protein